MNWNAIDTVFFDMDGTLIDLHFDHVFWKDYLPRCYAEHHKLPLEEVRQTLQDYNHSLIGTLNWYCLDHWDQFLGMNTIAIKEKLVHLIRFRPHVKEVLISLQQLPVQMAILTNAHARSFTLKNRQLSLTNYIDYVVSSHEFGYPKEMQEFWYALQKTHPFNPERCLFIDDNPDVLKSAEKYGIGHVMAISQPDTTLPSKNIQGFPILNNFKELLPEYDSSVIKSEKNTGEKE